MTTPDDDDVRLTPEEDRATREAGRKMLGRPQPPRMPIGQRLAAAVDVEAAARLREELQALARKEPTAEDRALLDLISARRPLDEVTESRILQHLWLNEALPAEEAAALWAAYNHAVKR